MKLRLLVIALAMLNIFNFGCSKNRLANVQSWLCYYQAKFPTQEIPNYDLYVFDSYDYPPLEPLKKEGAKVVGYLSVGEVARHDYFFNTIKEKELFVDENENWPGSFRIKIGSPIWHDFVLNHLIPRIIAKGFNGVFLDTIDTADYIENVKNISGSIKGTKDLLKKLRKKYPDLIVIMNNGLFFLSDVGKYIDGVVVEDLFTSYDFLKKKYKTPDKEWTRQRMVPLKKFQAKFKKPVFTLGYLEPTQKELIQEVTAKARENGFVPYFSDIHLTTIFYHP